ncbi:MAG TPA: pyrroline-5-carboxylate reductase dimerization domain-containing protein [Dehalococcoidia bacterium]|nr:pyrroline-5-carboxylate reductase dimerization domain-containing protein [Dehalococcoidia bacterium]
MVRRGRCFESTDPAHFFLFGEGTVHADVRIGLPRDTARESMIQTILGCSRNVEKTDNHPADLRNMVTSPGATTTEVLLQFEEGRFRFLLSGAVAAAYK